METTRFPDSNQAHLAGTRRPVVMIYVLRDCTICDAAYGVAESIRREFPEIQVKLVDLTDPGEATPASVCAVPTYRLNGSRWMLGNPSPTEVRETLQQLTRKGKLGAGTQDTEDRKAHPMAAAWFPLPAAHQQNEEYTVKNEERATTVQPAEKMRYLSELAVFQDLTSREMEELNRITTMSTVPKGRVFYRPEEPGEVLFILKEGRVQLYRISPEGKKLVITTLGPHTLFGEMALLGAKMHNTFAEAVEDCLICVMSRTDLERLILSKPQVALRLLEITGKRLREAEERLENMAFKGIPARLASLLLRLATEQSSDEITGLTHQDLAESVGTYRETATQVLNDLKGGGYIEIGRKRIKLLNREGLETVAES